MQDDHTISVDQLRIGLYVHLDLPWFKHPFAFNHFKIKNQEQIDTIRGLGLRTVRINPELTDPPQAAAATPPTTPAPASPAASTPASATTAAPAPAAANAAPAVSASPGAPAKPDASGVKTASEPDETKKPEAEVSPYIARALEAKRAMIKQITIQREAAARIENAFVNTAKTVHEVEKNLLTRPAETVKQATQLISQIADSILCAPELAIHVMGDKMGGEELYFHSLNVTTLSLMVAREIKLPLEVVGTLGMGALLHDIGRKEIPNRILMKLEPLSNAERHLYEMHCQYGVEMAKRLQLAAPVVSIIHEHHEFFDGSGYPQKLKGETISLLARIVAITNHYDELCNPVNIATALTPHEALSIMFAKLRNKFDPKLLQIFVRCLGVYPPGTIVQLSNGLIGMIATVNTARPMKPMIVVYDADIPKEEAILVDLEVETDLNIAKAIRPAQVSGEIYNYLSPRKRVSYYFDPAKPAQEAGAK